MVDTITPVVHGGRNRSFYWSAAAHFLGAAGSGALFGGVLGGLGGLFGAPWGGGSTALAALAGAYALAEMAGRPLPTFAARRQVPEWWRGFFSPATAALLYGFGLGVGFVTFLPSGAYLVACAAAFASGSVPAGALLGGLFGGARAGAVTAAGALAPSPEAALDALDRLGSGPWPRLASAASLALVSIAGLWG